MLKLNPLEDPHYIYIAKHFGDKAVVLVIDFSILPGRREKCRQSIRTNYEHPQIPPLNFSDCLREVSSLNNIKQTSSQLRQYTASRSYFGFVVGENKFGEDILHKIIKTPYSFKSYSAAHCNEHFECPAKEEISLSLKTSRIDQFCKIIQFFNFLLFDKVAITVVSNAEEDLIYFNNSNLLSYIRTSSSYNYERFQHIDERYLKTSGFINKFYTICYNNALRCSWYFICDYNQDEIIEIEKMCDFNFDCQDQSDERFCSNKTHFNCITGFPVSVSRSKVNDNQIDCSDRSDECKDNPISSAEEIIKNPTLRKYIWFSTVAIFFLNIIAVIKCYTEMKNLDKTRLVSFYNLVFVINLSISDIIFGFVLATLALFSSKFSGKYCLNDLEWRSSLPCNVIGILTIVSSQTSLILLALMTGFRLYTIYKPFNSLDKFKNKVIYLLIICWFIPILLSITPIVLQKQFMQSMLISSNMFLKNKSVDSIVNFADLNENNQMKDNLSYSIPLLKNKNFTEHFKNWFMNIGEMKREYPNTSIVVKNTFGFYSSSSVCLPDFYSKSLLARNYSFVLMSFNLLLIILISVGYLLIFFEIRSSKVNNRSRNKSKNERKFMIRVFLIVATDIVCWLPIIAFTYASYSGWMIPDIVHPLSSIVLLPINSVINPFLYSRVEIVLYEIIKKLVKKCYERVNVRKVRASLLHGASLFHEATRLEKPICLHETSLV